MIGKRIQKQLLKGLGVRNPGLHTRVRERDRGFSHGTAGGVGTGRIGTGGMGIGKLGESKSQIDMFEVPSVPFCERLSCRCDRFSSRVDRMVAACASMLGQLGPFGFAQAIHEEFEALFRIDQFSNPPSIERFGHGVCCNGWSDVGLGHRRGDIIAIPPVFWVTGQKIRQFEIGRRVAGGHQLVRNLLLAQGGGRLVVELHLLGAPELPDMARSAHLSKLPSRFGVDASVGRWIFKTLRSESFPRA